MTLMTDKLRADFDLVTATRIASGVWSKGDEALAGKAIALAIKTNDSEALRLWACWLAKLAMQDLMDRVDLAAPVEIARACANCQHLKTPRGSVGGCGGREDLARMYGKNHPLRVLPADGGASCARFARAC